MTTTTTTTTGQQGSNPPKNGANGANADAKAKATLEAKNEKDRIKNKLRKQKVKEKKNDNNNNNNNYVKFDGLIAECVMKGVTISPGSNATMTSDFRNMKKSAAVYAASKGYEHWPGVIEIMKPVDNKMWKTKPPDKSLYAVKYIIKLVNNLDKSEILKQEWVVTDCEVQEELEDNYSNMQRQKLTKQGLYREHGAAMFTVLYGQLHADIITIAKRSVFPDFVTVHKDRDVVDLLSILRSICVQNLTGSKVDPYSEHLKILTSTLSYTQKKGVSNNKFGDAVLDQVSAAQSQCGVFAFGENYHIKVLNDDGVSNLKDYFSFDRDRKIKFDELARQLVCARLIINNSLSSKTRTFLKEQYIVNQSYYPDNVIEAVAMITSFGNDDIIGRGNNKNTNKIPEAIVSIHLADCGDNCSNDNGGSVASFESTANDRETTDDNDLPDVSAPVVNSEFGNDNINENIETNDDGDDGDNNDNNDTTPMSGNNDEENPKEDHPVTNNDDTMPNNDDTDSSTPTDENPTWTSLLVVADDDVDDDPGDYNEFHSDYDLDDDGVFDNDDAVEGEEYCCTTVTNSLDPQVDDEFEDDDILL